MHEVVSFEFVFLNEKLRALQNFWYRGTMLPSMVWQQQYFWVLQDKEGTAVGRHVVWNLEGKFLMSIIDYITNIKNNELSECYFSGA